MRITVDLNRCQAYAQCCSLAPDVFQLLGREVIYYDPEPEDHHRLQILRSKAACPVQAITVEDGASRDELAKRVR